MSLLQIKNISSLEKVFPKKDCSAPEINRGSALLGEEYSYQIALKADAPGINFHTLDFELSSDIADSVSVYNVKNVPVLLNHFYGQSDDNYISLEPGLFPDILEPYNGEVNVSPELFTALWVSVKVPKTAAPGIHEIKITFKGWDGQVWGDSVFSLEVIGVTLPELDIPNTNWFHCDCISTYYGLEPLSEEHFAMIDNFMQAAVSHGMNMILTPIFTPPLDTKVGSERPTVQLVDVSCENGKYSFGFDKLIRWMKMCEKNGIRYLEISHLFSQWGAEKTPKIVVLENGEYIKKFGWHTDALSDEYKDFLTQLLPPLKEVLAEYWDKEKVYFHISDEPSEGHIAYYGEIFNFIKPLLGDFKQMDAISDYELFDKGYIETPVVATSRIYDFVNAKADGFWAYYCCGQGVNNLSNRFIAMPSWRNRIMGAQLYKYDVKGFLQWGYNFFYSKLSTHPINPFLTNDGDGGLPAGDTFSVYPGMNGAIPSLRLKVFHEGLQDMMAAKLLESYIGKDAVTAILEKDEQVGFNICPSSPDVILSAREEINRKIAEAING